VRARRLYGGGIADQAPDPDDWWAEPVPSRDIFKPEPDEDWLAAPADEPRPRRALPTTVERRTRVLIAAVVAAIVLIALGLVVAGVFSNSTPKPAAPPTTTPTTTARTTTTTPTKPKKTTVVGPSVTLTPGALGSQTKRLQLALASLGNRPGPIDGDYGPLTKAAVERFQRSKGLTADGIFGPKTLAALRRALSRS
jgi:hypothetical protein